MSVHLISGHARPSATFRKSLGLLHGAGTLVRMDRIMEDAEAIDAFGRLLTEAMGKCQTKDGRVDMRDVAAFVLAEMKGNQK